MRFSKLFPIPKFLAMPTVGLDISEDCIRFLEFKDTSKGKIISRFAERALPRGVIVGGDIIEREVLKGILRHVRNEFNLKYVHVALPEEKIYLFKTEVPDAGGKSIREFLELRLEENVPLSAREASFDYMVIKRETKGSAHIDISVSAVSSKFVGSYINVLYGSGLVPITLQTEAQAIGHAIIHEGDMKTYLIVNFGETKTGLYIMSEGTVRFSSILQIGGEAFTQAIGKYFMVDMAKAEEIKKEKAFTRNRENMEFFYSLMNTVSVVKDEIKKLIFYWQTHRDQNNEPGKKIDSIILCGKNSSIIGFDEYLSLSTRTRVHLANVWTSAFSFDDYIPPVHFNDSLNLATVVGLALTPND